MRLRVVVRVALRLSCDTGLKKILKYRLRATGPLSDNEKNWYFRELRLKLRVRNDVLFSCH